MASSRKRPPKPDPADGVLLSALQRALAAAGGPSDAPLVLAYSGGPDSTVLLDLAWRLREARAPGFGRLHAVHVHHGLLAQADAWVAHCERECERRALALSVQRVQVPARPPRGRGIEDGARRARYAALAREAARVGARCVLTAHHADDRIETFLLQWLRGAGLEGLAGIAGARDLPGAPGEEPLRLLRPLLEFARSQLEDYLRRHGLEAVEDPSNLDPRFARNALRLHVLPPLARVRSGFRKSALRSIELIGEAAEALQELAREGLETCRADAPPGMLRIDRLALQPAARRPLILRAWLAGQGLEAPSRARLHEALAQALGAGGDGRMLIRIGEHELRRHRGLLVLRAAGEQRRPARAPEPFYWNGEAERVVGAWGGVLRFVPAREGGAHGRSRAGSEWFGFDPHWLREQPLEVRARTGGERFKPHALRPSKPLKHWFQEAGVPEFERAALPLLWRDGRLIFVAGLGGDARLLEPGPERVRIEWSGEASLLSDDGQ
jgi:tRNA(Ile)-lysidine synthase